MEEADEGTAIPYAIDTTWFDENNFSFTDFVRARVSPAALARLDEGIEERRTIIDKKTGRVSFDVQRVTFEDNPIRFFREHCARERDYITPDMPTLEAIFRVLLANGNQPMTLEAIREQLSGWCPGGGCQWLLLPIESLERLVQNEQHYGIRPHELATAAA